MPHPPPAGPTKTGESIAGLQRRLDEAALTFGRTNGQPRAGEARVTEAASASGATAPGGDKANANGDRLTLALLDIASHYGRPVAREVVTAGLPLIDGCLPLAHVAEAANRASLDVEVTRGSLTALPDAALPVLVWLDPVGPDIVWAFERDEAGTITAAMMSEPGKPHLGLAMALAELPNTTSAIIVRLKPSMAADARQADLPRARDRSWLWPAFADNRRIYAEVIAATLVVNILALALPLFMMNVYDRVLPNAAVETLWALAIGVLLATLFDFLIKVLRSAFIDTASRRTDVRLGNLIFARLLGAKVKATATSAGVRANTLREFETLRDFFNSMTVTTLGDLPFVILFIAMIGVIAGPLALIPLAGIPLLLGAAWITQWKLARLTEASFRQSGQKSAVAVEMLVGLDTIKTTQAESWAARSWEMAVSEHIRTSNEIRYVSNLGQLTIQAAQTIIQIVMIIAGFYMLAAGNITMGALIAATMLAGRAVQPLGVLAGLIARLYQARIAYRSLSEIVNAEQERPPGATLIQPERIEGHIAFENVSFGYDADAAPVLVGVSFTIKPGERVAIVGGIGGGKSTILRLIYGLQTPDSGRVLIDAIPATQLDPASLRSHVGLAIQSADLFHGTIRSNIALDGAQLAPAALLRAAEDAAALDWITRLAKGFDTPVRERGIGLSGGQRQSLVLARALARRSPVLLLDEPTSDMDPASEARVVQRLSDARDDRTIIVVTHRPALLDLVSRIIVLEAGRIVLDGPKASVLAAMKARSHGRTRKPDAQPAARTAPHTICITAAQPPANRDGTT